MRSVSGNCFFTTSRSSASRTAIPALARVVSDRDSWEIRFAAANALGVAGKDEQNVPDVRALRALIDATDDVSKEVRLEALQSLINLGPPTSPQDVAQIKTLLERKIKADKDKSVAIWARVALMRMDAAAVNDANLTAIAKLIKGSDLATSIQAARALGAIGLESKGKVPDLMDVWIAWVNTPQPDYHPVLAATIAHHGFEAVHPFNDGNGRVGRLLMNLMLMQDGYPPALVLREWRTRYITALQAGHRGDYTDLVNLIGLAVEHSLDLYLEACQASTAHLLPLKELATLFGLDNNYLDQLARLGKVEATKRGSFWYASREAIQRYLREAQEQPRGRRPNRNMQPGDEHVL